MNNKSINNLLKQYLNNTITKDDLEQLMHYISQASTDDDLSRSMKEQWELDENSYPFDDLQNELLYQKIVADPRFSGDGSTTPKPVFPFRRFISIAAGLLLFLGIGFAGYRYLKPAAHPQEIAYEEKIVPFGQKIQIQLADGTVVWINSGSKLRFPAKFTGEKRELYLDGEAYFDVAHDPSRPFIIHTGKVATQVLGTAFDIKAYGSNEFDVTVARGKVSVGLIDQQLGVLTAQEGLSYNSISKLSKKYPVTLSKLRWMFGDLIFDNMKMSDAVETLQRWYDVKITLTDPQIRSRRFSASFLKHEHISQVLDVLSAIAHFTYKQQGKNFIIQKQQ
ncbi:FecR family protein [Mucilaginibacter sp. SG564]|uniref:FecR family protein n=1 Tax=Mucilaginibacter sp. SG564 TaxID=2587022 RepID=UPI0015582CC1|nr:FecR domain-containing protein [Mucilaginibacter sp. SG564]NOW94946.1 ferric-dicitrate binding protein FerR (iron transport regulator) [Mucilaginibacter sp. SG564]